MGDQPPEEAAVWHVVKQYNEGDIDFFNQLVKQFGPLGDLEAWGKAFVKTPEAAMHRVNITDHEAPTLDLTGTRIFFEHRYDSRTALPCSNETDAGRLIPQANARPVGTVYRTVHNSAGAKGHEVWVQLKFDAQNLGDSEEKQLRDMLRSNRLADLSICYVEERTSGDMYKSGGVKKTIPEVSLCRRGRLPETHIIAVQASDSKYDDDTMAESTTLSGTAESGGANVDDLPKEGATPMNVDAQGGGAPAAAATGTEQQPPPASTPAAAPPAASEQTPPAAAPDPMQLIMQRMEAMEKSNKASQEALLQMIKAGQLSDGHAPPPPAKPSEKPAAPATETSKPAATPPASQEKPPSAKPDPVIEDKLKRQQEEFAKKHESELAAIKEQLAGFYKSVQDEKKQALEARTASLQARASKCGLTVPKDASAAMLDSFEQAVKQVEVANKALDAEKKRTSSEAAQANKTAMNAAIGAKRPIGELGDKPGQGDAKKARIGGGVGSTVDQRFQHAEKPANLSNSMGVLMGALQETRGSYPGSIFTDDTLMTIAFAR